MRGIMSDRDMMQLCLDQAKHAASYLTTFIMECSNPGLRQECMNALNNVLQEQHSCYELMHQRGWYQPIPADSHIMTTAQQSLNTMLSQTGSMGTSMGMPMGTNQMGSGGMTGYEQMGSGQSAMSGYGQSGMSGYGQSGMSGYGQSGMMSGYNPSGMSSYGQSGSSAATPGMGSVYPSMGTTHSSAGSSLSGISTDQTGLTGQAGLGSKQQKS